jgi:hypothetical protein
MPEAVTVGSLVMRDKTEFRSALSAILRNLALEYYDIQVSCLSVEERAEESGQLSKRRVFVIDSKALERK